MSTEKITFSSKAIADARKLFKALDYGSLKHMVSNSARVTHPEGNRRYKDYVFEFFNGTVKSISRYQVGVAVAPKTRCPLCEGTGEFVAHDECPHCYGEAPYCKACNWTGSIKTKHFCKCKSHKH